LIKSLNWTLPFALRLSPSGAPPIGRRRPMKHRSITHATVFQEPCFILADFDTLLS
jgi:hypothetical protein